LRDRPFLFPSATQAALGKGLDHLGAVARAACRVHSPADAIELKLPIKIIL
jgi:hypothetical protein